MLRRYEHTWRADPFAVDELSECCRLSYVRHQGYTFNMFCLQLPASFSIWSTSCSTYVYH